MRLHQPRHLVIRKRRELRRDSGRPDVFDRRYGQHKHLGVIAERLQRAPARIQIRQCIVVAEHSLAVVAKLCRRHRLLEMALQAIQIASREDVGESVDPPHQSLLMS